MSTHTRRAELSELREVHFILRPAEACCVVQCVRMVRELLHQTTACYGRDGDVSLAELNEKLIRQVEDQR